MKLKKTIEVDIPVGMYLVEFNTIWGSECNEGKHTDCMSHGCWDNEPSYVAEVDYTVTKVTKENMLGEGMDLNSNTADCYDDTHDFRSRVFKNKREATEYAKGIVEKFNNPMPWQSFVKLG